MSNHLTFMVFNDQMEAIKEEFKDYPGAIQINPCDEGSSLITIKIFNGLTMLNLFHAGEEYGIKKMMSKDTVLLSHTTPDGETVLQPYEKINCDTTFKRKSLWTKVDKKNNLK